MSDCFIVKHATVDGISKFHVTMWDNELTYTNLLYEVTSCRRNCRAVDVTTLNCSVNVAHQRI